MADDEKLAESMRSGTDWEVVSLTSSAYAAAPNKGENAFDGSKLDANQESSLSESGHHVFLPSEHENFPVDALNEIGRNTKDQENVPDEYVGEEEQRVEGKMDEEVVMVPRETGSEVEKHDDGLNSGPEDKKGKEEGKEDGLEWVKKRGMWLYRHVKEANTVWSVMVAAALVGLVILGQRWQREKSQHQYQLK